MLQFEIYFFDSNWSDKQNSEWNWNIIDYDRQMQNFKFVFLLLQKNYIGKFSAEKVEQIMFKYP